jgi:hypothetical protein
MLLWNGPSNSVPQPTGHVAPDEGLAIVESPISHTFVVSTAAGAAAAPVRTPQSGRPAAVAGAGGRLVSDGHAPKWWILADAEGNEACVATWVGRG